MYFYTVVGYYYYYYYLSERSHFTTLRFTCITYSAGRWPNPDRRGQGFGRPVTGQCDLPDQQSGQHRAEAAGLTGHADQRYGVLRQPAVTGEEHLSPQISVLTVQFIQSIAVTVLSQCNFGCILGTKKCACVCICSTRRSPVVPLGCSICLIVVTSSQEKYSLKQTSDVKMEFLCTVDGGSSHCALAQAAAIHFEKVARREIGAYTTPKTKSRSKLLTPPASGKEPAKGYSRVPISFSILDSVGHCFQVNWIPLD